MIFLILVMLLLLQYLKQMAQHQRGLPTQCQEVTMYILRRRLSKTPIMRQNGTVLQMTQ